jgi:two-component system, cell cycle sensor histidine kinase and response regulator CckA
MPPARILIADDERKEREEGLTTVALNLNGLIADTEPLLRNLLGEAIELVMNLAPDLGAVKADPTQLQQVLLNLARNAREAMPRGGTFRIATANSNPEDALTGPLSGPCVLLLVSDTGGGMDEATRAHLFELCFTTREPGQVTGLGLVTVAGIVEQCGGHIAVRSKPDQGTTFTLTFPRVDVPPTPVRPRGGAAGPRGTETVLVVEDQDGVRALTCRVLERQGYTVLQAPLGAEALTLVAGHSGPIHLLITDVIMPEMNGWQLAQRLAPLRPEMKVLYLSGYTNEVALPEDVLARGVAFQSKPFTVEALATKVRELLDGTEPGALSEPEA